jgi:cytochrome c-type biogenesis protein CcmH/NrfG
MSLHDIFWFLIGTMTAVVVMPVVRSLLPRRSEAPAHGPLRRYVLPAVCALIVAAAALGFYLRLGSPDHLQTAARTAPPAAAPASATPVAPLEESARKLALRLARDGGSAADWRLLGQSYDFLGQAANAKDAYARAAGAVGAPGMTAGGVSASAEPAVATAAQLAPAPPAAEPDGADRAELARAAQLREARNFTAAGAIYARLATKGVMSADAWADYADVAGSLHGGKLTGTPATYIAQALRLDARHPKALWLEASLAHEEARDADALATWRLLSQVLPADASDQKIIAANIAEATRLARSESAAGTAPQAPLARITGTVDIAAQFVGRAPQSATLFVYAKQADGAGPPLAVLRTRPGRWPVEFVLDDSLAMVPGRNLSGARSVEVEARLSVSGNAMPQRGDFAGTVVGVDPRAGRPVHIAINHEIG